MIRYLLDTNSVKTETIGIRKKTKLRLPDSVIVATAVVKDAIVVTSDKQILNLRQVKSKELFELNDNQNQNFQWLPSSAKG